MDQYEDSVSAAVRNTHQQLASAKERSRLFWLLGEGLLNGLTTEPWATVRIASSGEAVGTALQLSSAWKNLLDALEHSDANTTAHLAVEHTRLFSGLGEGAGPAPPFESAWRQGQAREIAAAVTFFYSDAGFADIDVQAGPQDHLAVELKFVALLALREAEAWGMEDLAAAEARIQQQQQFLDHHLLQWVPRWIDKVAQMTQEPVYWAFAGLISAVLAHTAETLRTAAD